MENIYTKPLFFGSPINLTKFIIIFCFLLLHGYPVWGQARACKMLTATTSCHFMTTSDASTPKNKILASCLKFLIEIVLKQRLSLCPNLERVWCFQTCSSNFYYWGLFIQNISLVWIYFYLYRLPLSSRILFSRTPPTPGLSLDWENFNFKLASITFINFSDIISSLKYSAE